MIFNFVLPDEAEEALPRGNLQGILWLLYAVTALFWAVF
jgi:hypothetical protein